MGQYLQLGPISCWRAVCPAFSGEFRSGYVQTMPLSHVFLHGSHTLHSVFLHVFLRALHSKAKQFLYAKPCSHVCKAKSSTTPVHFENSKNVSARFSKFSHAGFNWKTVEKSRAPEARGQRGQLPPLPWWCGGSTGAASALFKKALSSYILYT